jgi:hypothetical protein
VEPHLEGREQSRWFARLLIKIENLQTALSVSLAHEVEESWLFAESNAV